MSVAVSPCPLWSMATTCTSAFMRAAATANDRLAGAVEEASVAYGKKGWGRGRRKSRTKCDWEQAAVGWRVDVPRGWVPLIVATFCHRCAKSWCPEKRIRGISEPFSRSCTEQNSGGSL